MPDCALLRTPFRLQYNDNLPLYLAQRRIHTLTRGATNIIDPELCVIVTRASYLSYDLRRAAATLLDAITSTATTTTFLLEQCDFNLVVNPHTLHPLHRHVLQCPFFQSLATVRNSAVRILSKVLNIICQKRSWSKVIIDTVMEDVRICSVLVQLIVCTLLGAYEHCVADTCPDWNTRRAVYAAFHMSSRELTPACVYTVIAWLTFCPWVVKTALREYMVFALQSDPVLMEHLREHIRFDEYARIVRNDGVVIRRLLNFHVQQHGCDAFNSFQTTCIAPLHKMSMEQLLHACTARKTVQRCTRVVQTLHDTNAPIQHSGIWTCFKWTKNSSNISDAAMVNIAYRLPRKHMTDILLSMHLYDALIPRPNVENITTVTVKAEPLDEATAYLRHLMASDTPMVANSEHDNSNTSASLNHCLNHMDTYLTSEQQHALHTLTRYAICMYRVRRENYIDCGVDQLAALHFVMLHASRVLGVNEEVMTTARGWITAYYTNAASEKMIKSSLRAMREHHPYAYNVLLLASELIREATCDPVLHSLPWHITQSQLRKLHEIDSQEVARNRQSLFVFCHVCDRVYSFVRDFHTAFQTTYDVALRCASTHYTTGEPYCTQNIINRCGSCRAQPLSYVCLIGHVFTHAQRSYTLCPLCARVMRLSMRDCMWTRNGPVCVQCTQSQVLRNSCKSDMLHSVEQELDVAVCCMCSVPPERPFRIHRARCFPMRVFVCNTHYCFAMREQVQARVNMLLAEHQLHTLTKQSVITHLHDIANTQADRRWNQRTSSALSTEKHKSRVKRMRKK